MIDQDLDAKLGRLEGRLGRLELNGRRADDRQERYFMLAGRQASWEVRRRSRLRDLSEAEFRVTSQWGEDGIIDWLTEYLPIANRCFVEFGVENYREANTRFLLQNRNWRGLVMDGNADYMAALRQEPLYWRHDVTAVHAFITRDNINSLITDAGIEGDIGLLSIDIDGNDYWVLEALSVVSPRILVIEYNPILGDRHPVVVPYREDFARLKAHCCGLYFGASIAALVALAKRKGYVFVGTCSSGINAFFVRSDLFGCIDDRITEKQAWPSVHRDSRDEAGRLTHTRGTRRFDLIRHLPVVLPEEGGRTVTLQSLMPVYSPDWMLAMEGRPA